MSEFADKVRSLGYLSRGRTRPRVTEGRRSERDPGVDAGQRTKSTTDELGNTVTESSNRQDVMIRAPHVRVGIQQTEVRQ